MIQRLQSIFLFLAGLLLLGTAIHIRVKADDFLSIIGENPAPFFSTAILGLLCFYCIFLFKKIKTQLKVTTITIALVALFILVHVVLHFMSEVADFQSFMLHLAPVVLSLVFLFIARSFMKKDEKLLNSYDRLR